MLQIADSVVKHRQLVSMRPLDAEGYPSCDPKITSAMRDSADAVCVVKNVVECPTLIRLILQISSERSHESNAIWPCEC
jgi:hypothetical protein